LNAQIILTDGEIHEMIPRELPLGGPWVMGFLGTYLKQFGTEL
jgi:hypothetical protein